MDKLTKYILLTENEKSKLINQKCHKVHLMLKAMKKSSLFSKLFTNIGHLSMACETKVNAVYLKSKGDMKRAQRNQKQVDVYLKNASKQIASMKRKDPKAAAAVQKIVDYINKL